MTELLVALPPPDSDNPEPPSFAQLAAEAIAWESKELTCASADRTASWLCAAAAAAASSGSSPCAQLD
eukprot:3867696-Amphidinium_carterae.1